MTTPTPEHAPNRALDDLRRRPHWSFSSIASYAICNLQWAFGRVYRVPPAHTSVNLVFGKTFHQVLTWVAMQRRLGTVPRPDTVQDQFGDLWRQACQLTVPAIKFAEDETSEKLLATGRAMLGAYMANLNPEERILGVAVPFSVLLRDAAGVALASPLIGELDCVTDSPDGPIIVDWKTAAKRWSPNKATLDLQPTCYLYAVPEYDRRPVRGFRFEIITKTKEPAVQCCDTTRDQDSVERLVETVKVIERQVRAEAFLPNDQSWSCGDCPYAEPCKSWHRRRGRGESLYRLELAA